jgi:hypothetical protein
MAYPNLFTPTSPAEACAGRGGVRAGHVVIGGIRVDKAQVVLAWLREHRRIDL